METYKVLVDFIRFFRRNEFCLWNGVEGMGEVVNGGDEIFRKFLEGEFAGGDLFAL